jgi:predicted 2-oxoglutarate/Fe(II)-dependent dioxygenase YbiX
MQHSFAAEKQVPLRIGERLCDLPFLSPAGRGFSFYHNQIYGWPKAVFVSPSAERDAAELSRFAALIHDFGQTETHLVAVTRSAPEENAAVAQRLGLQFPVLSDPEGRLAGLADLDAEAGSGTLMFDPVLRLERRITAADGASQAEAALAHARARAANLRPVVVRAQAPVLVVPNVLDPDHCRRLMDYWEAGEKRANSVVSPSDRANRRSGATKSRADVILPEESPESQELVAVVSRRLLPEVLKALGFRVSRLESFRVGCYDADSQGHFAPHRDNTTPLTEHRRFAVTINLNSGDYEGGYLRLPEYGPQLYAPPAGGAVVFSCSLLHLATPVQKGRRFVVVGFFWGEEEQRLYEKRQSELGAAQDTL